MLKLKLDKKPKVMNWYQSPSDKILMFFINLGLGIATLLVLVPLLFILASSFSSGEAVAAGRVYLWPVDFNLRSYAMILENSAILTGFQNSILYTGIAVVMGVSLTMLLAYPLSRKDLKGRSFFTLVMLITMFFSGGMIPTYLFLKSIGLMNTMWAVILPMVLTPYNVIITRSYIESNIPIDLYESASLDGCSDFKYFLRVVVPLSATIIAIIALLYGVSMWNNYFNAMMYITDSSKYPLQVVLRNILILGQGIADSGDVDNAQELLMMSTLLKYSTIVVSCVPMMIAYSFVQKYFVKGIMVGALKG